MIVDSIANAKRYEGLHSGFAAAFDFMKNYPADGLKDGRYDIDGDNCYALVQRYPTLDAQALRLETHREYIDIQFIAQGRESLGWRDAGGLAPSGAYDAQKDVAFFAEKPSAFFTLGEGEFAVFFPHDAHMPRVSAPEGARDVVKIVVKVRA